MNLRGDRAMGLSVARGWACPALPMCLRVRGPQEGQQARVGALVSFALVMHLSGGPGSHLTGGLHRAIRGPARSAMGWRGALTLD